MWCYLGSARKLYLPGSFSSRTYRRSWVCFFTQAGASCRVSEGLRELERRQEKERPLEGRQESSNLPRRFRKPQRWDHPEAISVCAVAVRICLSATAILEPFSTLQGQGGFNMLLTSEKSLLSKIPSPKCLRRDIHEEREKCFIFENPVHGGCK